MPPKHPFRTMTLGQRLLAARKATGLSTRAVAERIRRVAPVSHATIANYERDASRPPIDVMSALATVYERPINWFLGNSPSLAGIRYRNLKSRVKVRDRQRFEGDCLRWLDAYAAIEKHLKEASVADLVFAVHRKETAPDAAMRFRREALGLDDDDPLPSVVEILERLGVRVMEVETDLAIDGLAARWGDEFVVMLNAGVSNDRARLNAAHETAHVLRGDCEAAEETPEQERAAFEFASHMLLTSSMLREAFKRKSVVQLVRFKERFGISLAAMVYRAQKERLIREAEAKHLWIEFAKRGWRSNEPGSVWADRATRFEALIDTALVEGKATLSHLAKVGGVREEDLRRRLALATGAEDYDLAQEEPCTEHHRLRIVR